MIFALLVWRTLFRPITSVVHIILKSLNAAPIDPFCLLELYSFLLNKIFSFTLMKTLHLSGIAIFHGGRWLTVKINLEMLFFSSFSDVNSDFQYRYFFYFLHSHLDVIIIASAFPTSCLHAGLFLFDQRNRNVPATQRLQPLECISSLHREMRYTCICWSNWRKKCNFNDYSYIFIGIQIITAMFIFSPVRFAKRHHCSHDNVTIICSLL